MARKSRKVTLADDNNVVITPLTFPSYVYARISNDGDHAEDSIENQIAICKEYINADNELTYAGVFTDLGFSGTNFERPAYSDMMAGILCGDIKSVVVKDLSRLGRTYIEVGELLFDTFVQRGMRFVSVNDRYDSFSDDAGRKKLLILFKNLVNHMYSRDLSKKTRSAHTAKKQRGEPAGQAPFGYCLDSVSKRLLIEPGAAEIVKTAFNMRLSGESVSKISQYLNQNKIPSPQQRRYELGEISHEKYSKRIVWSATSVSKILHCETYTGVLFRGKYKCSGKHHKLLPRDEWIVFENAHDAIISREQFDAVSHLMEKSAAKYEHKSLTPRHENRYAGKIVCSRCGKVAIRNNSTTRDDLFYYSCRHCNAEIKYETGIKRAALLPLTKLDSFIMTTFRKYMDMLVQFDGLNETLANSDTLRNKRMSIEKEKNRLEKAVADYDKNLATAYKHHLDGILDMREYGLVRSKAEREKIELEARLLTVKNEQAKYDSKNILENKWLEAYRSFRDRETPTKEMIQALIRRITLTPITNHLEIELNFEDCFAELREIMMEGGVTINV
jgi:DNA invertase Pin-like site-specific DNA recombinase/predicted RNA-binding Zn-ribbon protein involved in translation (DUF1610 family)